MISRGRWVVVDQVLSSGSNFLLSFVLVRSIGPRAFGAFGVALITYQLIVAFSRTQASEPLAIRYGASGEAEWAAATRESTGFALALGVLAGAASAAAGLAADGDLRTSLLLLGLALPFLLLQDAWRFVFFAQGRPARAAANDLIWTVVQIAVLAAVAVAGSMSITGAMLAWAAAAAVAAVAGAVQSGCLPAPGRALAWAGQTRALGAVLGGDLVVRGLSLQASLFLVGGLAGLASVGYLRAGMLVFGPLYALVQAVVPFAVGESVRRETERPGSMRRAAASLSGLLGAAGLALGVVLMLLPGPAGEAVLGPSWEGTRPLIPAMTVLAVAAGLVTGPAVGLRALPAVGRLLRVSLLLAPVTVLLAGAGAGYWGAPGAAWGLAAANVLTAAALAWQFRSALRHRESLPGPAAAG